MDSPDPIRTAITRRRQSLSLPKRRTHMSLALCVMAGIICGPLLMAQWIGNDEDAQPKGSVSVASLPPDQMPSPLDAPDDLFPDLLASMVPVGENPTDSIASTDALGNPINTAPKPQSAPPPAPKTITLPASQPKAPPLDPKLTRQSQYGPIPGPNRAGKTPLQAYRFSSPVMGNRIPVALIVGGLGINAPLTERAIMELPSVVTLSFAAQTPNLQSWIDKARARGHEVLIEIPMESDGVKATQAGPDRTLLVTASPEANRRNLHFLLSRAQGYAGIINYQGDLFLRRSDAIGPLLSEVKASGLGLFVDGSFAAPTVQPLAQSVSVPFKSAFGFIDPAPSSTVINARLDALSTEAKTAPNALGIGFAYPQTIDAVKGWAATLAQENLVLVPATSTLK